VAAGVAYAGETVVFGIECDGAATFATGIADFEGGFDAERAAIDFIAFFS
jgi:hypothetical protein